MASIKAAKINYSKNCGSKNYSKNYSKIYDGKNCGRKITAAKI